jgi:hypothetical protein
MFWRICQQLETLGCKQPRVGNDKMNPGHTHSLYSYSQYTFFVSREWNVSSSNLSKIYGFKRSHILLMGVSLVNKSWVLASAKRNKSSNKSNGFFTLKCFYLDLHLARQSEHCLGLVRRQEETRTNPRWQVQNGCSITPITWRWSISCAVLLNSFTRLHTCSHF